MKFFIFSCGILPLLERLSAAINPIQQIPMILAKKPHACSMQSLSYLEDEPKNVAKFAQLI
jgi:hypothetical protein